MRKDYRYITIDGESIPEHRWVMSQHIGRPLRAVELVHHVNNNHLDNRIENLQIMSRDEHARHHWKNGEYFNPKGVTEGQRQARSEIAYRFGKKVMISDIHGNDFMTVRSVGMACMITGIPKTTLHEVIDGSKNNATGPYKFRRA